MSLNNRAVAELHGIYAPGHSARPDKRGRDIDDGAKSPWTRSEPTPIRTPRQVGPSNPYDPRSNPKPGNRTAAAIVTGGQSSSKNLNWRDPRPPPPKKQKLNSVFNEHLGVESKFFPGNVSSTMSLHNGSGSVPKATSSYIGKGKEPMHYEPLANGKTKQFNLDVSAPIVIFDDMEDEDIGTRIQRKSSRDELDIMASANSSMSIAEDLGVSVPNNDHPFKQQSPPRLFPSRTAAKDGASSQRLRKRVGNMETRPNSAGPSRSKSPTPPKIVDIDEIEDFSDHNAVSSVGGARSKPPSTISTSPTPKRSTTPSGTTVFTMNSVQAKAQMFESKSKSKPTAPEVDLLKLRLPRGLTSGMKGKSGKAVLQIEQEETRDHPRDTRKVNRKDQVATSSTSYRGGLDEIALPLDVCIWGSNILEKDPEAHAPNYWLCWNKESSELQIREHPIQRGGSRQKVVKRVKTDRLQNCELEISQVSAKPFIKLRFRNSVPGIQRDEQAVGLAFKFLSPHSNMNTGITSIKSELEKLSGSSRSLVGAAVDSAYDMSREEARQYKLLPNTMSNSDTLEDEKKKFVDEHGSKPARAEEKPSIKPRPAYGKQAAMNPMEPKRRSARLAPEPTSPPASSANLDEVVLVYPHSGPGALNITNGDLKRLEPSEFLNDTLIELGLKFLMNDIREKDPELADEIHVFSTFFYKKLNHKNFEEGYKSVRKWTTRVNLFKKKYIIVPINENIHWYLAIIYRPEYILEPAAPKAPPRTSRRTSKLDTLETQETPVNEDTEPAHNHNSETVALVNHQSPATMQGNDSDASVERVIQSTRSCSISDAHEPQHGRTDSPELGNEDFIECNTSNGVLGNVEGGGPAQARDIDVTVSDSEEGRTDEEVDELADDNEFVYPTPASTRFPPSANATDHPADGEDAPMEIDSPSFESVLHKHTGMQPRPSESFSNQPSLDVENESMRPVSPINDKSRSVVDAEGVSGNGNAVPTTSFHEPPATDEPRKIPMGYRRLRAWDPGYIKPVYAGHKMALDSEDEKDDDADNMSTEFDTPSERVTWVFTFDSLGTRHDKACKLLSRYLCAEAQDKMHFENPSPAKGKEALVPTQPNFCDCGLYLLHFARTFLNDPDKFKHMICTTPKKQKASERGEVWQDRQVANMRKEMMDRIRKESEVYKKIKEEKENQKKEATGDSVGQAPAADSSDDEIIVGPITKRVPSPVKRGKKANGIATASADPGSSQPQAPKEARASRLRG